MWPKKIYKLKNAKFMIDNKISCVLTEPNLRIFSENTSGWLQLQKKIAKTFGVDCFCSNCLNDHGIRV